MALLLTLDSDLARWGDGSHGTLAPSIARRLAVAALPRMLRMRLPEARSVTNDGDGESFFDHRRVTTA